MDGIGVVASWLVEFISASWLEAFVRMKKKKKPEYYYDVPKNKKMKVDEIRIWNGRSMVCYRPFSPVKVGRGQKININPSKPSLLVGKKEYLLFKEKGK